MRALVTGGTGFVGSALCERWLDAGHEVTVLSRRPESVRERFGGRAVGVADLEALPAAPGPDVIVNLAGAPIVDKRWSAKRRDVLLQSRLDVTRAAVSYATRCETPPKVFLSTSAVGYYGYHQDEPLDESAPNEPGDFLADLCNAWEREALKAQDAGLRTCILRLGVVLGLDGGALEKMLPVFRKGLGGRLGDGKQYMSWIHRDDVLGLLEFLVAQDKLSGAFNATAPTPVTNAAFTKALGEALSRPTIFAVPGFALRLALGEAADVLLGGQRVIPQRAMDAGYTFAHPDVASALNSILA